MKNFLYLFVNIATIAIPFVYSFHPRLRFWDRIKPFLLANFITGLFFIVWDSYFTYLGVWGFTPDYLTGIYVFNLPIEEILFFLCIPYACVFSYHCFGVLLKLNPIANTKLVSLALIFLSLILTVVYIDNYYTTSTFFLLAVFLTFIEFIKKVTWIKQYYITYAAMILPFFIVNGILTGFGLEAPIVWYNENEMIGYRMLTIPFEDAFYGFLLVGINIYLMELFESKKVFKQNS
ncbi:MAG TPA: lycopene cyclase domain-containing protein [Flavobacteriaceae bacterium]|nr:lycopene cyclase domain-containing protein [Flavobacteriaceae bacterium]